jgi:hypothetical protein
MAFSYFVTCVPLQWNSPFSISQIAFNAFAALVSTTVGYGITKMAEGFFLHKKKSLPPPPPIPKVLTQSEQALVVQHLFPSPPSSLTSTQATGNQNLSMTEQAQIEQPLPSLPLVPMAKQETRYRALSEPEQTQKRVALYQALYSLTQDSETKISYMKDYHGNDIFLSRQDLSLIMIGKGAYEWTIRLASDGNYTSHFSQNICGIEANLIVTNGKEIVLGNPSAAVRLVKKDEGKKDEQVVVEYIHTNGDILDTEPRQIFLDHDNALIELLIFKQEQIVTSFQKEQWNARLNSLQMNIVSLFGQIRKQKAPTSPSQVLISPLAFPVSESITLGPIWSPVAASQDSFFQWTIEHDTQDNIYLKFIKEAGNRGYMGGVSSRAIRFKQDAKGELFVDIFKGHANDLEDSSSRVSYQLRFKDSQLFFIPLSAQSQYYCCLFGDNFQSVSDQKPASDQIKRDFELIISSLITVGDIIRSPESVIVDPKAKQAAISFTGKPLSPEQAKHLTTFDQGRGCSGTMSYSAPRLNPTLRIKSQ